MNIVVIGTGYVGLVSGTCFAEFGFNVTCVDKIAEKITKLQQGIVPIYEPALDDMVKRNIKAGRLSFSCDLKDALKNSDVVFIAVGTPTKKDDGCADLQYVYASAKEIALSLDDRYRLIVVKSTVPVGTGRKVAQIIKVNNEKANFDMASNPEFLREGSAIEDFMHPDRVVIGTDTEKAQKIMAKLYEPLSKDNVPLLFTEIETSELIKYTANAFLAMKITFINEISDLCEKCGANIRDVAKGIGLDSRIGSKFLQAGPGYGGSCFPKDTLALIQIGKEYSSPIRSIETVVSINEKRKKDMAYRIIDALGGSVEGKDIAVLGVTFKPNTDDMREAPALDILPILTKAGAKLKAYDPKGMDEAAKLLKDIEWTASSNEALKDADALVILTEWEEFYKITPTDLKKLMKGKTIIDLRNVMDLKAMKDEGFTYSCIGC